MTDAELALAKSVADGFDGRFVFVETTGVLMYEPPGMSLENGDDCHVISDIIDDHVAEPIAIRLNLFPILVAEVARLRSLVKATVR